MRRRALSLALAFALLLLPLGAGLVAAKGTLDQEYAPAAPCCDVSSGGNLVQTFTAGISGYLDTVSLNGYASIGASWQVEIRSAVGGIPSGPVLGSGSAPATGTGPGTPAWDDITITPTPPVTAGATYAITVVGPTPAWRFDNPATYAGGSFNAGPGDALFRTYVTTSARESRYELRVTNEVSAAADGPYGSSLTAPTGSTAWHRIGVTNESDSGLVGMTFGDSSAGGALPAGCPPIPSPFAVRATYTCTYSAPVLAGTTTYTVTASFAEARARAEATVTGTAAPTPTPTIAPTPAPTASGSPAELTMPPTSTLSEPTTGDGSLLPALVLLLGSGLLALAVTSVRSRRRG